MSLEEPGTRSPPVKRTALLIKQKDMLDESIKLRQRIEELEHTTKKHNTMIHIISGIFGVMISIALLT